MAQKLCLELCPFPVAKAQPLMNSKVSILCDLSLQGLIGHETQPRLHRDPLGPGTQVRPPGSTFEQVQALTSGSFPASLQPPLCQSPLQYQPHRSSLEIDSVQKKCLMCLNSFARNLENVILHSAGQR